MYLCLFLFMLRNCCCIFIIFNVFSSHSRGVHVYLAPLNLLQIQSFKDTNTFFVSLLVSISFVFLHFHCFHCFPKSQSRCPSAREYKFAYLQNKAAVALVRKKQKLYKNYTNTIQIWKQLIISKTKQLLCQWERINFVQTTPGTNCSQIPCFTKISLKDFFLPNYTVTLQWEGCAMFIFLKKQIYVWYIHTSWHCVFLHVFNIFHDSLPPILTKLVNDQIFHYPCIKTLVLLLLGVPSFYDQH